MTNGEKATKCLDLLEEMDVKTVVNLLHKYASDEELAMLYDEITERY